MDGLSEAQGKIVSNSSKFYENSLFYQNSSKISKTQFTGYSSYVQCTMVDKNHGNILAKKSVTDGFFFLNQSIRTKIEVKPPLKHWIPLKNVLVSKAIKARNLVLTGLVIHTFVKKWILDLCSIKCKKNS